jgi:chromosomal replication initiation ATPase DnaA|tara:strand:- start:912 stop:1205 length:294 start_codon:yes stop_codon:yes gene_type:complete
MKRKIFDQYVEIVENALEITKNDIFTKTRKRENVEARDLLFYLCSQRNMRGNFILNRCKENGLDLDDSQITRGKAKIEELISSDPDWKQLIKGILND